MIFALAFALLLAPAADEPIGDLFGNTVLGTSNHGTDRYVFRADNSYLALFAKGEPHAGWWRTDDRDICFFQVLPVRDDIVGCLPIGGLATTGGKPGASWQVEGETMTVAAGVDPALARHGFETLAGGPTDPMRGLYGQKVVRSSGGEAGTYEFAPDHSYRFTSVAGAVEQGGWGLTTKKLCLFRLSPRGRGERPVPCIASFKALRAGRWRFAGATFAVQQQARPGA